MNARQKAKFYKKKYEELANMPYPNVKVESVPVVELVSERVYPAELVETITPDICGFMESDYMRSHAMDDLVPALQDHVNYDVDLDASTSGYRVTAKMKVVERSPYDFWYGVPKAYVKGSERFGGVNNGSNE